MFTGLHEIALQILGTVPLGFEILYFIVDLLLIFIIFFAFIFIILLPIKLMRGW